MLLMLFTQPNLTIDVSQQSIFLPLLYNFNDKYVKFLPRELYKCNKG